MSKDTDKLRKLITSYNQQADKITKYLESGGHKEEDYQLWKDLRRDCLGSAVNLAACVELIEERDKAIQRLAKAQNQ